LLAIILIGLILTITDRQRQAMKFDIKSFLDGYKHTAVLDTSKAVVIAQTNALKKTQPAGRQAQPEGDLQIADGYGESSININTADAGELQMLPGVGPVLAQRIIAFRDSAGAINNADNLLKVKGVGQNKLTKMLRYISFE